MASSKLKRTFLEPLGKDNLSYQILGLFNLAVTNKLDNTMVMVIGVMFTTALSSWTIFRMRKAIQTRIRMKARRWSLLLM